MALRHLCGELGAEATEPPGLVAITTCPVFSIGRVNGRHVQRHETPQVDDLRLDPVRRERRRWRSVRGVTMIE